MISFRILTLGSLSQSFIQVGEAEYLTRLRRMAKIEVLEIDNRRLSKLSEGEQKKREGELVLKEVRSGEYLCVLDERGRQFSSLEFAQHLQKVMNTGSSRVVLAIGGPFGWDEGVRARADLLLSLSPMTFSYQLTRLVLAEQLYRVLSIIAGSPYHK